MSSFFHQIQPLEGGNMEDELTQKLRALVLTCEDLKKGGELTLKVKIKPGKTHIEVSADVSVKAPKPDRDTTILYATVDGYLQRQDPNQRTLEGVREVGGMAKPVKTVNAK